jgi:hypothetical protein
MTQEAHMTQAISFKKLPIAAGFVFATERDPRFQFSGIARGPWIKTGPRSYEHLDNRALRRRVGKATAEVFAVEMASCGRCGKPIASDTNEFGTAIYCHTCASAAPEVKSALRDMMRCPVCEMERPHPWPYCHDCRRSTLLAHPELHRWDPALITLAGWPREVQPSDVADGPGGPGMFMVKGGRATYDEVRMTGRRGPTFYLFRHESAWQSQASRWIPADTTLIWMYRR